MILLYSSLFCIKKEFLLEGRQVFLVKLIISESITLFVTFACLCFVLLQVFILKYYIVIEMAILLAIKIAMGTKVTNRRLSCTYK